jgi:dolichol-phosphate mannosyltransferase
MRLAGVEPEMIRYCDITFRGSVRELISTVKPGTIFDLSAYGAYSRQSDVSLIYNTNVLGCVNILEECNQDTIYVHGGSSSEYGRNCSGPSESDTLQPNSHYSISKVASSYMIDYYGKVRGIPCVNLRLFSIYGPWEEPDRFIPMLIEHGRNGSLPPLVNPRTSRDFVYIDDCIEALIRSANMASDPDVRGSSINIGTGVKTTIEEVVQIARDELAIVAQPVWGSMENRTWDEADWFGNYTLAEKLIGWRPKKSLIDGLRSTILWQQNSAYETRILPAFTTPYRVVTISPVIACYKDEQAIPIMYQRLVETFQKIGCRYQIIFVNDGSPDNTQAVLQDLCNRDENVVAIQHSRNFGSQAAFASGMEIATGDAVVLMDGDLQDPPEIIPSFIEEWLKGNDVVYGRRVKREASWFMGLSYRLFYRVFAKMANIRIPLDAGDFSLIDRRVVEHLIRLPEKEQFLRGLRAWVGFKQVGVDYVRPERPFGHSTNNIRRNIGWAKKGIFSFSYVPLEIMSYIGLFLTGLSMVAIVFQITARLLRPDIPHGITTIIVLVLFFGGANLLGLAVIGEYLAKVVDETKSRPKFIRDNVIVKGQSVRVTSELEQLSNK